MKIGKMSLGGLFIVFAGMLLAMVGSSRGQSYSLAGDWNGVANPNGVWSYGYISNGAFVSFGLGDGIYGAGSASAPFIYKYTGTSPAYGINPGQVSLEADGGTPDVRFIAPASAKYTLALAVGGTTASEGGGYGNVDTQNAGLDINGTGIPGNYNSSLNVESWNLTEPLSAGSIVDVYVGAGYGGGNTQTIFQVSVPEPASGYLLALCATGLCLQRKSRAIG